MTWIPDENLVLLWPMGHGYPTPHCSRYTPIGWRRSGKMVNGTTPDISLYGQFDWYEPVYFWDPVKGFPNEKKRIGRWIGVVEN